MERLPQRLAEN